MFSSKSFIVYGLTFRSLIHFECIFMYGIRKCPNFILLHVAINNLRYADDTTLMAESEKELKSLLMKVKEREKLA